MPTDVPSIFYSRDSGFLWSNSQTPPSIPDTAASWKPNTLKSVQHDLLNCRPIVCKDATAHTAVTALALQILLNGTLIVPKIEKVY